MLSRNKFFYLLATGILACGAPANATGSSVASVPEGFFCFNFPATTVTTNLYLSLPLTKSPAYTGTVDSVTANSISVADVPAPWTAGALATAGSPYFVKFLTGSEVGRVIKVTGNSSTTLTLDTTDNSSQTVSLTTSNFSVEAGDTFEVFLGDTLASVFGTPNSSTPLVLTASSTPSKCDTVSLYSASLGTWVTYYFDSSAGYWKETGSTTNANSTVLYPYAGINITRYAGEAATSLVMTGRVSEVASLIKTTGSDVDTFTSTHFASNVTLAQLQFGSNWTKGTSAFTADTLAIWDAGMRKFDTYYQMPDSTWRKWGNPSTNQSNLIIAAGSVVSILKRSAVTGAASFLQSSLPYAVN